MAALEALPVRLIPVLGDAFGGDAVVVGQFVNSRITKIRDVHKRERGDCPNDIGGCHGV
jgi:hypothetical protein